MPSPFPGMDPWLEDPTLWPGVHDSLAVYARDQLQGRLIPRYYVEVEHRVYLESPDEARRVVTPDVLAIETPRGRSGPSIAVAPPEADPATVVDLGGLEVREAYLEIRTLKGHRVVTVIEFLSYANKQRGPGRELYLKKQQEVLASDANLVEVDLLRGGEHTVSVPEILVRDAPYRVVVSRASDRTKRWIHRMALTERLPRVAVPLLAPDPDTVLDLQAVFGQLYENGAYAHRIDYTRAPEPPLGPEDANRAREALARRAG